MKKSILALGLAASLFSVSPGNLKAQNNGGYDFSDHAQVAGVNMLLNGIVSGIGAVKNDKSFFSGFYGGALGSLLTSYGNYMVSRDENLAWPSKFLANTGASISYNASRGKPLFDTFGIEIGPLYLTSEKRGENREFNWYIIPGSVIGIAGAIAEGSKFDLENSVMYGTPVFYGDIPDNLNLDGYVSGFYGSNVVTLDKEFLTRKAVRHELIHVNQSTSHRNLSSLLPDRYFGPNSFLLRNHIDIRTIPDGISDNIQDLFFDYGYSLREWEARTFSGYPPKNFNQ